MAITPIHVGPRTNHRGLSNFLMQANAAEMLRIACCLAVERGITVCCPVHDALLIEADVSLIDSAVAATQAAMQEASLIVLDGHELRTDVKVVRWPDRYMDSRGHEMWSNVMSLLDELAAPTTNTNVRTDAVLCPHSC